MSDELILKALCSSGIGAEISYVDEDGPSGVVNVPPRLGRSRIFAKEELMYPNNHQPQQHQFTLNPNPGFRCPLPKDPSTRNATSTIRNIDRPDNSQRRSKVLASRRPPNKDAINPEDENPLQRYENALLRYRKPTVGGLGGLRKDRREAHNSNNTGYSSSDSECTQRYNKSKSTSSIDTQSVNNILDEYEDLDYGRSSDLSDSGSINVTNFEAIMDQRKRHHQQQQQLQHHQDDRSNQPVAMEESGKESEVQHDQLATIPRSEPALFKVNQHTQVRQRSRDRQSVTRETSSKLNSSNEEPTRSATTGENQPSTENRTTMKSAPEVLLRKGEVQKRVDDWLNQTQSQNFPGTTPTKRESPRTVSLVRSSSSAESKNVRRVRNDARSRSTDENNEDRLNSTASYDDINSMDVTRIERRLNRTKNVAAGTSRGSYKDYLAVRNRARHADGGVGTGKSSDPVPGGSRILQRGHVNVRRRELVDDQTEDSASIAAATVVVKKEKNPSRSTRLAAGESRIAGSFVKTRPEQLSSNGRTAGSTQTPIFANGRAASFKRARSHDRNTGIVTSRGTGVLAREDQQSGTGNVRMRGGQQHQLVSKGQQRASIINQQATATSPNKVGESRRLLGAGRERRACEEPIQQACKSSEASTKKQQTTETEGDFAGKFNEETNFTQYLGNINTAVSNTGKTTDLDEIVGRMQNPVIATGHASLCSADEPNVVTPKLMRDNCNGTQLTKPPAPPRRNHSRCDNSESTQLHSDRQPIEQPCSSFRPTKRLYSALRQLVEQNFVTGVSVDFEVSSNESSPVKSQYGLTKQVDKIYEKTQPRVIHANDLGSILKPVVRASAYGEGPEGESMTNFKVSSKLLRTEVPEEPEDVRDNKTEKIEFDRSSERLRNPRYQEIDLGQRLKIQERSTSTKSVSKEVPTEKRGSPITHTMCWDRVQEPINEPLKTFGTFQTAMTSHCPSIEQIRTKSPCKIDDDIDEAVVADVTEESTYLEPDLIPKMKVSLLNSYEARSTLRLDRNHAGGNSKDFDQQQCQNVPVSDVNGPGNSQILHFKLDSYSSPTGVKRESNSSNIDDTKFSEVGEKKSFTRDKVVEDRGAVVNEFLVKNLRFQQELMNQDSPQRLVGPIIAPKPFNFNSVLSDDYDKIHAGDCSAQQIDECRIYVTKEEMERQRMINMLQRGEYGAVKLVSIYECRNYLI